MAKVQHFRGLNTNLDSLYNNIKQVLQDRKELRIVSEYKGLLNSIRLRSIVAVNTSPKVWAGSLREIHVSITGSPDDYAVEVASGAWFGSLVSPGAVGLVVAGPIGLAAGVAVGGINEGIEVEQYSKCKTGKSNMRKCITDQSHVL